MSWNHSMMPDVPGCERETAPEIDRVARHLATAAGANWDLLPKHPGVERGKWRKEAELLVAKLR
jgi:hypothetical protein